MASVVKIATSVAENALGPLALRILRVWWRFRDNDTLSTRATAARVAREVSKPLRTVERAIQRLVISGLVSRAFVLRDSKRKIATRRVYGRAGDGVLWVPRTAADWMQRVAACRHGGDRRSALFQVAGRSLSSSNRKGSSSPATPPAPQEKNRRAGASGSERAFGAGERPNLRVVNTKGAAGVGFGPEPATQRDALLLDRQQTARRRLVEEHFPSPDFGVFSPRPPRVDPKDSDAFRARQIATAYRGAVQAVYRTESWLFRRGSITRSRHFKLFCAASRQLAKLSISPAAWAVWSCLVWRDQQKASRRKSRLKWPPLNYVWGAQSISRRAERFHADDGNTRVGGRPLADRAVSRLLADRNKAVLQILAGHDVVKVARHLFPAGYSKACQLVHAALRRRAQVLAARAQDGEFIWENEL